MAKDVRIKVGITNNIIPVKVSIGQTVERIVGPEKYTPAPITPTEEQQTIPTKDKQLTDNVVVGPIPSEYIIPTGNIEITENGQYDVTKKASVSVDVRNEDYDNALPALGVTDRLTDGINALTTYSNGVTGKADTTLSDAVHTLGSGYGGGTTYPFLVSYEKIDVTEDLTSMTTTTFQNTYLPDLNSPPYPTILYLIENTYTDSRYAAQAAIRLSSLSGSFSFGTARFFVRAPGQVTAGNNFFGIGQGSIIHKYTFETA